jgi:hypothetical protein
MRVLFAGTSVAEIRKDEILLSTYYDRARSGDEGSVTVDIEQAFFVTIFRIYNVKAKLASVNCSFVINDDIGITGYLHIRLGNKNV